MVDLDDLRSFTSRKISWSVVSTSLHFLTFNQSILKFEFEIKPTPRDFDCLILREVLALELEPPLFFKKRSSVSAPELTGKPK
jgi:hypothetical protein